MKKKKNKYGSQTVSAATASDQTDFFSNVIAEMAMEDSGFAEQLNMLGPIHPSKYSHSAAITKPTQQTITDKQLRALDRVHLCIMLRDQEKELRQIREERDNLLLVCQARPQQGWPVHEW